MAWKGGQYFVNDALSQRDPQLNGDWRLNIVDARLTLSLTIGQCWGHVLCYLNQLPYYVISIITTKGHLQYTRYTNETLLICSWCTHLGLGTELETFDISTEGCQCFMYWCLQLIPIWNTLAANPKINEAWLTWIFRIVVWLYHFHFCL